MLPGNQLSRFNFVTDMQSFNHFKQHWTVMLVNIDQLDIKYNNI